MRSSTSTRTSTPKGTTSTSGNRASAAVDPSQITGYYNPVEAQQIAIVEEEEFNQGVHEPLLGVIPSAPLAPPVGGAPRVVVSAVAYTGRNEDNDGTRNGRIDNNDIETRANAALTRHVTRKVSSSKKSWCRRYALQMLFGFMVIAGVFVFILVYDLPLHVASSSGDTLLTDQNVTHLSAASKSWNSGFCGDWRWSLYNSLGENMESRKGKKFTYRVPSAEEGFAASTASVSCHNIFGTLIGEGSVSWNVMVLQSAVRTDDAYKSLITVCPVFHTNSSTAVMVVDADSRLINMVAGDVLVSSNCGGMILNIIANPTALTGLVAVSNEASLEKVFSTLSLPSTQIPMVKVSANTSHEAPARKLSYGHRRQITSYNIIDESNWYLKYASDIISGSVLFDQLTWDCLTTLKSLTYTGDQFAGVVWHASTSVFIDLALTMNISAGQVSYLTVPLFTSISSPKMVSVPTLEFIAANSDIDIRLIVSATSSMEDGLMSTNWKFSAQFSYEWEISCSAAPSWACHGKKIASSLNYELQPIASLSRMSSSSSTVASASISASLIATVGLQLDEILVVNDEVFVDFVLQAPTSLLCPSMGVKFSSSAELDFRLFSLDAPTMFTYTAYDGALVDAQLPDSLQCAPTASPTASPSLFLNNTQFILAYGYPFNTCSQPYFCVNNGADGEDTQLCNNPCSGSHCAGELGTWTYYSSPRTVELIVAPSTEYSAYKYNIGLVNYAGSLETPQINYINLDTLTWYGSGYSVDGVGNYENRVTAEVRMCLMDMYSTMTCTECLKSLN
jgi:hypothetical protein